jgi:hypothetical protein
MFWYRDAVTEQPPQQLARHTWGGSPRHRDHRNVMGTKLDSPTLGAGQQGIRILVVAAALISVRPYSNAGSKTRHLTPPSDTWRIRVAISE